VVQGILRSHGGAVTADSQPGYGATFTLYFPLVDAPPAQLAQSPDAARTAIAPAGESQQRATPGHSARVLIVDDEDALVFLLSRTLQRLGYAVTGCTNPSQALQMFRSQPEAFDVVVTDLSMPGMNGFDLARDVLAARPDMPIVMTTGYARPEDQERIARSGIRELILKPDTVDEMSAVLDRVFREMRGETTATATAT